MLFTQSTRTQEAPTMSHISRLRRLPYMTPLTPLEPQLTPRTWRDVARTALGVIGTVLVVWALAIGFLLL